MRPPSLPSRWLIVYFGISTTSFASCDDRLARQARQRRQSPRAIEQIVLVLGRRRQRVETLAHDARGTSCRRTTSRTRARRRCPGRAGCRAATCRSRPRRSCLRGRARRAAGRRSRAWRFSRSVSMRLPGSARFTPRSMRRAANSSVARFSASTAARSADVVARLAHVREIARAPRRSPRARASASSSPSAASAARVASTIGRPRPAPRPARARACRRRRARTTPAASARSRRRQGRTTA